MGTIHVNGIGDVNIAGDEPTPAEEAAIMAHYQEHGISQGGAGMRGVIHGMTGGLDHYVGAGIGTLMGRGSFEDNLNAIKSRAMEAERSYPETWMSGDVAGTMVGSLLAPEAQAARKAFNFTTGAVRSGLDTPNLRDENGDLNLWDIAKNAGIGGAANTIGADYLGKVWNAANTSSAGQLARNVAVSNLGLGAVGSLPGGPLLHSAAGALYSGLEHAFPQLARAGRSTADALGHGAQYLQSGIDWLGTTAPKAASAVESGSAQYFRDLLNYVGWTGGTAGEAGWNKD